MEKILSFDVGIIHLAYCFLTKKEYIENDKKIYKWEIMDWAIIDLTDREEHKCSLCKKPAKLLQTYGGEKYYCKVHSKNVVSKPILFEDYFKTLENKKIRGCDFILSENEKCNKNCMFQTNNSEPHSYCTPHAKKTYTSLETNMKLKSIKKFDILGSFFSYN